jgi:hypothetical protein
MPGETHRRIPRIKTNFGEKAFQRLSGNSYVRANLLTISLVELLASPPSPIWAAVSIDEKLEPLAYVQEMFLKSSMSV